MRFFKKSDNEDSQPSAAESDNPAPGTSTDAPQAHTDATLAAIVNRIPGVVDAAIVDQTGALVAAVGDGALDLATAGFIDVFRAECDVLEVLDLEGQLEDILITLHTQYHLIRPLDRGAAVLCIVVDKGRGNLGLARHHLRSIDAESPDAHAGADASPSELRPAS